LSINNKRTGITLQDLLSVAEDFAIKNAKRIIQEVQDVVPEWRLLAQNLDIPSFVIEAVEKEFQIFAL
jgi:serine/threonine-protein kinase HipA